MSGTFVSLDDLGTAQPAAEGGFVPLSDVAEEGGWGHNLNTIATGVARGIGGVAGLPEMVSHADRWVLKRILGDDLGGRVADWVSPAQAMGAPTAEGATKAILDTAGVPETEATTRAGKIGQRAVEFATGSVAPGGVVRNLLIGGAAGAMSEAAGQATEGTVLEPYARVAGAVAAPGAAAAAGALRGGGIARDAATALEKLTPQQADAAKALMADAERLGSPITVAEAVQKVAGPNRALQGAQDLAQNSVGGRRVMDPFLDARDAGARTAAERVVEPFTPSGRNAALIPARIQEEAGKEVSAAYRARSEAAAPFYAQAAEDAAKPGTANAVRTITQGAANRLDALAAKDQSGLLAPQVEAIKRSFDGVTDWDSLNRARRFFRDQLRDQGVPGAPVLDREIARAGGEIIQQMTGALQRAVPALRRADAEYVRLSREVVDPVERGLVGRVAQTDSASAQRGLLFPRNTMGGAVPTTPEAAGDAFGRIAGPTATRGRVDQEAIINARGLLGAELQTRLDEALQLRSSGPGDRSGANVASRMAPNEGRADALDAAFRALPDGDKAADGFRKLMDVLGAQTFQPARNSTTAPRIAAEKEAGRGGFLGTVRTAANPFKAAPEWLENWRRNANTEDLARALTTPAGLERLRAMAGIDDPAKLAAVSRSLIAIGAAARSSQRPGDGATQ